MKSKIEILIRINGKEIEKEVTQEEYDFIVKTLGVPSEKISNCCGSTVEENICTDCLEHCGTVYVFG